MCGRWSARGERLREADIREIHRLVLGPVAADAAGRYSLSQRAVLGSPVRFPMPAEIALLMADFARWLAEAAAGYEPAFEAHYRLVTIHPFDDGIGRAARLLMNLVLLRAGYPPVAIGPDQRVVYLDALQPRQTGESRASYDAFMRERLRDSLARYVAHLEGPPAVTGTPLASPVKRD